MGILLFKASNDNLYIAEVHCDGAAGTNPRLLPPGPDLTRCVLAGSSLRVNDCILEIDGVPMLGQSLKRAHAIVLGAPGSAISFKVARSKTQRVQSPGSARVVSPRTGTSTRLAARCF